jgi:hypothetical protein
MAAGLPISIENTRNAVGFPVRRGGSAMYSNPIENLIEPAWRRFARCTVCVFVGGGAVLLLMAVLTFLNPVLP